MNKNLTRLICAIALALCGAACSVETASPNTADEPTAVDCAGGGEHADDGAGGTGGATDEQDVCAACTEDAMCVGAPAFCADPVGHSADFGDTRQVYGGIAFGYAITLEAPREVRALAVLSGGAGPVVRMALYDRSSGARLVVSDDVALGAALEVTEAPVPTTLLEPGSYWVVLHTQASTPIRGSFDGDTGYETLFLGERDFADGLPEQLGDEAEVTTDYRYNFYALAVAE